MIGVMVPLGLTCLSTLLLVKNPACGKVSIVSASVVCLHVSCHSELSGLCRVNQNYTASIGLSPGGMGGRGPVGLASLVTMSPSVEQPFHALA